MLYETGNAPRETPRKVGSMNIGRPKSAASPSDNPDQTSLGEPSPTVFEVGLDLF